MRATKACRGSCKLGYEHHAGSGECRQCPEMRVSCGRALATVSWAARASWAARRASVPSRHHRRRPAHGAERPGDYVQCARILLAFLQVQALIDYALGPRRGHVEYGSMPADPYFIAQSAYCLRTIAGEAWYLRPMLIIGLPFMVAAVIGVVWVAAPDLPRRPFPPCVAEAGGAGGGKRGPGCGWVPTDLVMKDLDEDHDGKVTKDEFKQFWKKHKHDHINKKELLMADTIILIFFIYPSIVREVFSFFSCEGRGPGLWLLSADTGVECYSAKHSLWMTFIGIPGIVFFCGVLPLLAVGKLKHMKRYALLEDMNMVRKFGFLYRGYEEDYCYWEILVTARKIAIVFIAVFFKSYGQWFGG